MYTLTETQTDGETVYGIKCESQVFDDISPDKKAVEMLCEKCNSLSLDEVHLKDVVDDFKMFIKSCTFYS